MTERQPPFIEDEALDRAVQEALAIEPSPEFRARVRAKLAEQPIPVPAARWPMVAMAAAVLVVAVAIFGQHEPAPVPGRPARAVAPTMPAPVASVGPAAEDGARPQPPAAALRPADARAATQAPRFDPREQEAFEWLLSVGQAAPAATAIIEAEFAVPDQDVLVTPIEIPAVDVLPQPPLVGSEGGPWS